MRRNLTVTTKGEKMNDSATSHIKQILTSFDNFVMILENPNWIKVAKAEDIKTAFKLGCFLEKSVAHFKSKNSLQEFMRMLHKWWNTKNRTKVYTEFFFQYACDQLLIKFFKCENVVETTLDIAVRIYTSIFPRERLQNVLSNLLLFSSSYEAVTDFAKVNMTDNDRNELEFSLTLINWSNLLETDRENVIREAIVNYLSLYKIESSLYKLIGILSLSDVSKSEKHIQNLILDSVLQKMLDRSVLSKTFWLTLFKEVNSHRICKVCSNFHEFLESVFSFIVYIGGMMKKEDDIWKSDNVTSLCPEISYHDLLVFVRNIYHSKPALKEYVITALNEAKEHTDSSVWDNIKQDIIL